LAVHRQRQIDARLRAVQVARAGFVDFHRQLFGQRQQGARVQLADPCRLPLAMMLPLASMTLTL
jgi:hypothetical protein